MRSTIIALSLLPSTALAADFEVPSMATPTLAEAIALAAANDRILLAPGTYDGAYTIDKQLTILPQPGEAGEVLPLPVLTNTTSNDPIFTIVPDSTGALVGSFNLNEVRIQGGGDHGVVRGVDSVRSVRLRDVVAEDLSTTGNGALIDLVGANTVQLVDVQVTGTSAVNGGAIYHIGAANTSTLQISGVSNFEGAEATLGGFIYSENVNLNISDATFDEASATTGGFIHHVVEEGRPSTLTLTNSAFIGGFAEELGGAVYSDNATVSISGSLFDGNTAASGGGLWATQSETDSRTVSMSNAVFTSNSATGLGSSVEAMAGTGGGLVADVATVVANTSRFETNTAVTGGGAHLTGETVNFGSTELNENEAEAGGAAWVTSTTTTVTGLRASSNRATVGSGGAFWLSTTDALIRGRVFGDLPSSLVDNEAAGDGGALFLSDSVVTIEDFIVTDNRAERGGAFFRESSTEGLTIEDTRLFRNQATTGGALHATGAADIESRANHWCENSATTLGGAAYVEEAGLLVFNDSANGNAAERGGVYASIGSGNLELRDGTFVDNTATTGSVLAGDNVVGNAVFNNLVILDNDGSAFDGAVETGVSASFIGALGNVGDLFTGSWSGGMVTDAVDIADDYLLNNVPAACEEARLYPHARNLSLRDSGADGTDIGFSGGDSPPSYLTEDDDRDGFDRVDDCGDDDDMDVRPDAPDVCDGVDNDCDFLDVATPPEGSGIDEDPDQPWYADLDLDGFGNPDTVFDDLQCDSPAGDWSTNADDCDDLSEFVKPGATEECDGIDNDCDGLTDDSSAIDATEYYADVDRDGFGDLDVTEFGCDQPDGFVLDSTDCDDAIPAIFPGATERCDTVDNDCDGNVDGGAIDAPLWYPDTDEDGFGVTGPGLESCLPPLNHSREDGDCDDDDREVNPDANELCDGIDNDCEGTTDEDPVAPRYFIDNDLDGFGDETIPSVGSCNPLPGFILQGRDCNDDDAAINPGATEVCDDVDQDCNDRIDENPSDGLTFYLDTDGDGFGNAARDVRACELGAGQSENADDCDDNNDNVFPGNDELCDNIDNNCDDEIDENSALDVITWFADVDDDGFGNDDSTRMACNPPIGHVPFGGDCDDENNVSFPGRPEVCDGVDNDCNGEIDGPDANDVVFYFEDADGDGFGNAASELGACFLPEGYTSNSTDCDDTNAMVFPGAQEIRGNGTDEDCDGQDPPADVTGPPTDVPGPGCGCSSSSNPALGFAFAPFFIGLLLRRRRS